MLNPDQTLAFAKTQFAALTKLGQQWLDCGEQLAALQLEAGNVGHDLDRVGIRVGRHLDLQGDVDRNGRSILFRLGA